MTRAYRPAWLAAGFRVFFALAAAAAIAVMARTVLVLQGIAAPPAAGPFAWHGHELLFGFVGAAIAGFLLTAVPNWTGTRPTAGWPLAALAGIWIAARVGLWDGRPEAWGLAADVLFLPAVVATAALPLWRHGRARHWLPIAAVAVLAAANAGWHAAAVAGAPAAGSRLLAVTAMLLALLIAVIGGRITPAFTRNYLRRAGRSALPRADDWRDHAAIGASIVAALAELGAPVAGAAAAAPAAVLHALRLYGWRGTAAWREPLLLALHVGYGWLAAGYALRATALAGGGWAGPWALHGLLVGAVGTMTLTVMSRASLGHTGRPLRAGVLLALALAAVQVAALARLAGPWLGGQAWGVAGAAWGVAFALFLARCGPALALPARTA